MEEDYREFREKWERGTRDRECAIQLLYLAWMHWADPPFVTGMSDDPDALELWHQIYQWFGGEGSTDPEFLHVAGMMAHIFPWALGPEDEWAATAKRLKSRSFELQPNGFTAEMFDGRGDYGRYFAHQARFRASN